MWQLPYWEAISSIIKRELMKLSFQGASGLTDFSADQGQRSPTYVNIFQIQNGKPQLIGVYNPYSHNVTLTEAAPHNNDIPPDTFDTVHQLLPPWLGICLLISQGILFGLITTNLFLILKWKDETNIKAITLKSIFKLTHDDRLLCSYFVLHQ